ncbi:MAG: RNA 2'-phosphotransferase [Pontiellaceae bacterium]|nr:RNA 2'-phosphotransferase [Pontiellaceae bacterium]
MKKELIRKSKYLSLVLRHKPEAAGISLDANGWAEVDTLLRGALVNGVNISLAELLEIVVTNEKQRFVLDEDKKRIRANQGHSVEVDLGLKECEPPALLFHGTTERFSTAILSTGLNKMQRHHVHLSADTETAHKVGMRRGKVVIFAVDAEQMRRDGFRFYQSGNGVWLADSVPAGYLRFHSPEDKNTESDG